MDKRGLYAELGSGLGSIQQKWREEDENKAKTVHYWPRAGNPVVACGLWIEPAVKHIDDKSKVTCSRCLHFIAR